MAKYTQKELLHLRDSPLVKRPAHLPAIEQWIEYVFDDSNGTRERLRIPHSEGKSNARQPRTSGAAVAMGSFGHCNLAKARAARGGLFHAASFLSAR
ncbi:hypothetical protein K470DRAFT_259040 [Piedraia hortae CBS 480.64]|uniref:Uncharacterized protein n=1 Tax=Piedraia hortae CBS 480.64 TaxID=1314780 RepID=A0A6A7BVP2_9PEZI|nr:hypothetical protein K470DRAFT_259040 [Piedraia hortae CBS 480.64]